MREDLEEKLQKLEEQLGFVRKDHVLAFLHYLRWKQTYEAKTSFNKNGKKDQSKNLEDVLILE